MTIKEMKARLSATKRGHYVVITRKEAAELNEMLTELAELADEANGDPSSCSYNVPIGNRVKELRG